MADTFPLTDGAMTTAGALEELVTRPVAVEPSLPLTGPAFKKPWRDAGADRDARAAERIDVLDRELLGAAGRDRAAIGVGPRDGAVDLCTPVVPTPVAWIAAPVTRFPFKAASIATPTEFSP